MTDWKMKCAKLFMRYTDLLVDVRNMVEENGDDPLDWYDYATEIFTEDEMRELINMEK